MRVEADRRGLPAMSEVFAAHERMFARGGDGDGRRARPPARRGAYFLATTMVLIVAVTPSTTSTTTM